MKKIANLAELVSLFNAGKLKGFFDIEDPLYRAGPGISQSDIKNIIYPNTPMDYKRALSISTPPTEAMLIGTATHLGVFQPDEYAKQVVAEKKYDRRTKEGKAQAAEFEEAAKGKIIVPESVEDNIFKMAENVNKHEYLEPFLKNPDDNVIELTGYFYWCDLFLKFKADCVNISTQTIFELKTTTIGHEYAFRNSIRDYGYDIQAAMYLKAMKLITGKDFNFKWIVVEKKPPLHQVYLYRPSEKMLEHAEYKLIDALNLIKDCEATGYWPGPPKEPQEIDFKWYPKTTGEEENGEEEWFDDFV